MHHAYVRSKIPIPPQLCVCVEEKKFQPQFPGNVRRNNISYEFLNETILVLLGSSNGSNITNFRHMQFANGIGPTAVYS